MNVNDQLQKMIDNLTALKDDADKHERGQVAAGTRIRAAMQDVKTAAQDLRIRVLEDQKAKKG